MSDSYDDYEVKIQLAERAWEQALAEPEHEPWCDSVTKLLLSFPPKIPPCNCKPKREWQGLTDAEIDQFCNEWLVDGYSDIEEFVRTIMRELKEKNT